MPGAGASGLCSQGAGTWDDWLGCKADAARGVLHDPTITGTLTMSGLANLGSPGQWLSTALGFAPSANTANVLQAISPSGSSASLFASRTSDGSGGGMVPTLNAFMFNDNTAHPATGYVAYFEARRYAGAGITQGLEINATNYGDLVTVTPYTLAAPGMTAALWASAGRADLAGNNQNPSVVLGVPGNGAIRYQSGLVFGVNSVATSYVLDMAQGQQIVWHAPTGAIGGAIRSDVSAAAPAGAAIVFTNGGMVVQGPRGSTPLTLTDNLVTTTSLAVQGELTQGRYTVATLPTGCAPGMEAYAADGRKPGEAAGSGSGVFVDCLTRTPGAASGQWYPRAFVPSVVAK